MYTERVKAYLICGYPTIISTQKCYQFFIQTKKKKNPHIVKLIHFYALIRNT